MEKEKVFQILNELTKDMRPLRLSFEDYAYIENEHKVECFSHMSTSDENVTRVKEVLDRLGEDFLNSGIDFERFVMIIECNTKKELMMNEMDPIHEFIEKFIKDKKMCWGLSMHNGIEGVKITLVASI
ncbi:hypothetical protein [Phocaeicola coprocola]|jgi:hypothetical protein|uniref:hypothetical protein n=1 Tax=Phocaeicola coprocola TaxID=310298 RepID=UPI0026760A67|nr:hypothetical protein [Phocaeicola coprocola]